MSSAALRRSFQFDARVPAGIEGVTVAMNRIEKLSEIATVNRTNKSIRRAQTSANVYPIRIRSADPNNFQNLTGSGLPCGKIFMKMQLVVFMWSC